VVFPVGRRIVVPGGKHGHRSDSVIAGRLKLVKTEYSEDELSLDSNLASILLDFIREAEMDAFAKFGDEGAGIIESDLLFVCPMTWRHFHASPIGQDYIRPAGCCLVDCPNCGAVAGEWCNTDFPVPNGKRLPGAAAPSHPTGSNDHKAISRWYLGS
jgi:integrase